MSKHRHEDWSTSSKYRSRTPDYELRKRVSPPPHGSYRDYRDDGYYHRKSSSSRHAPPPPPSAAPLLSRSDHHHYPPPLMSVDVSFRSGGGGPPPSSSSYHLRLPPSTHHDHHPPSIYHESDVRHPRHQHLHHHSSSSKDDYRRSPPSSSSYPPDHHHHHHHRYDREMDYRRPSSSSSRRSRTPDSFDVRFHAHSSSRHLYDVRPPAYPPLPPTSMSRMADRYPRAGRKRHKEGRREGGGGLAGSSSSRVVEKKKQRLLFPVFDAKSGTWIEPSSKRARRKRVDPSLLAVGAPAPSPHDSSDSESEKEAKEEKPVVVVVAEDEKRTRKRKEEEEDPGKRKWKRDKSESSSSSSGSATSGSSGSDDSSDDDDDDESHDVRRGRASRRQVLAAKTIVIRKNEENGEAETAPDDAAGASLELSGKLAEDSNTVNGVVVKYSAPPDARAPRVKWRLYPFKGEQELPTLYVHRQSFYLLGRDRAVADIPLDHPSCSKQHAVLQFRLVDYERDDGTRGRRVRPFLIDLGSTNKSYINSKPIPAEKFVELKEKDVVKFGFSSREYVLLHEKSANSDDDEL